MCRLKLLLDPYHSQPISISTHRKGLHAKLTSPLIDLWFLQEGRQPSLTGMPCCAAIYQAWVK